MATDTLTHATAHAHEHGHHDAGGTKIFGFWIYLMSDCILFSILFATYAVLVNGTAGGPTGKDIFELPFVLVETFLLLFSSITYGMAAIAMLCAGRHARSARHFRSYLDGGADGANRPSRPDQH